MQSDKPLGYPCWAPILQHLNPELRLKLSMRCPAIRTADKTVPMKLDHFEIGPNQLVMNKTKLSVGIVSHYLDGYQPPQWAQLENETGGCPHDIGRFGDINDLSVQARMSKNRAPSDAETAQYFEDRRLLQEMLPKLDGKTAHSERGKLENMIKVLRTKIQNYNKQLAISELKFDNYIMLTINTGEIQRREVVRYDVPLKESLRYLAEKLFGKRKITSKNSNLRSCPTVYPSKFNLKSERERVLIEVEDRKIKSIEIPCCKGEFKNILRPSVSALASSIDITFYIPESEVVDTLKLVQNMDGKPKKLDDMLRENSSLKMNVKMEGIDKLWNFTVKLDDVKKDGKPGEDYCVNIYGTEEDVVDTTSRDMRDRFYAFNMRDRFYGYRI
ncbi:hypothetical protein CAEBREN_19394 [Caenorhabditis brenneri]|uniref:Uncharacterized protein n=1 Tax=Caenorhabditis brenneri TaxID=135651 RepID=G0MDT2_CAEBE|nr:hypothetical protein CAEBREN_19394 [Caenorhabditis brenneri]